MSAVPATVEDQLLIVLGIVAAAALALAFVLGAVVSAWLYERGERRR